MIVLRHPLKNLIHIEQFSLFVTLFIFIFIIFKSVTVLAFLALYALAVSLFSRAAIYWVFNQRQTAYIQGAQAFLLFALATYLLFAL